MPFSRKSYVPLLVVAVFIFISCSAFAQRPATIADQLTTPERLERSKWWTGGGRPGKNDDVGSRGGEQCHYAILKSQSRHSMARASVPAESSDALHDQAGQSFRLGEYEYKIIREASGTFHYTASNAGKTISSPVNW